MGKFDLFLISDLNSTQELLNSRWPENDVIQVFMAVNYRFALLDYFAN